MNVVLFGIVTDKSLDTSTEAAGGSQHPNT